MLIANGIERRGLLRIANHATGKGGSHAAKQLW